MKKFLFSCICALLAVAAFAQDEAPTVNWPYFYPDFVEGEVALSGGKTKTAKYNVHLGFSGLHYVENGTIKEMPSKGLLSLTVGEDVFRNAGGKMMKVLAKNEKGSVVQEVRANYSAIVSKDGAYGSSLANHDKSFSHEQHNGSYNGYLLTDDYKNLHAIKNDSDKLPVIKNYYLLIGIELIPANKKSVSAMYGIDKKAFSAFLKSEKITWNDAEDLLKVLEYVTANR